MKRKRDKPVTQRRRIVMPEDDEFEGVAEDMPQPKKKSWQQRRYEKEAEEWEQSVVDAFERQVERYNIYHAMKQVERARAALNQAQSRVDTKVAKAPKKVADDFRQFLLAGGTTSDQWMDWDLSKPKLAVPQKGGLRLVSNRTIVRYRLREDLLRLLRCGAIISMPSFRSSTSSGSLS